jgi:hypothetical protein
VKEVRDGQGMLAMLERGDLVAAFGDKMTETMATLKELTHDRPKAKAKATVTLKVELTSEQGAVSIIGEIVAKTPKVPRGSSFFWIGPNGGLTTEHPQQQDMFAGPREVSRTTA